MKAKKFITVLMLGAVPAGICAQQSVPQAGCPEKYHEGRQLCIEGHYYAASLSLTEYLKCGSTRYAEDAEALKLICSYYLNTSGTAEAIEKYLKTHKETPHADRLKLMMANLMVRNGHNNEALSIYSKADMGNLSEDEKADACLYEAIAWIETGNASRAKALLSVLANSKKHELDYMYYSSYVDYVEGHYSKALPGFIATAETHDFRRKSPVYTADCYLQLGRLDNALETIKEYNSIYGRTELSVEAKRIEGEALYGKGRFYEAINVLTEYTSEADSPKRTSLYKLGMSYFNTQAYGKAVENLVRSTSTAQDEMAQNAYLHAGICYIKLLNTKQARMAFQQASEMTFNRNVQEEALYNYALCVHQNNVSGFGESVKVFERFLNEFPNSQYSGKVSKCLTEVYFTTKNYDAALESINKIKSPGREIMTAKQKVLYNLGVQSFTNADFAKASDYMAQSIKLGKYDPQTCAEAYYWKGESEYRMENYKASSADLQRFVSSTQKKQKNFVNAFYSLGYTQFKQKNSSAALPYFQRFISESGKLDPNDQTAVAMRADAMNRIGDCLFTSRRYDEAYYYYQQATSIDHALGDYSIYQQAIICGLKGDYAKKIELLNGMVSQYPSSQYSDEALYEQGRAYVQSGDRTKAMQTFNELTSKHSQSVCARKAGNEIGMILFEDGKTDKAIKEYRKVIETYPNTPEAQTALSNLKDIFTDLGRVNEYAAIAAKAGKALSPQEMDDMLLNTANRAMANKDYKQALQYYKQLEQQSTSENLRYAALKGEMQSAYLAKDYKSTIEITTKMLDNSKTDPNTAMEARFNRAESYIATKQTEEALNDWRILSMDTRTEYGAQATIKLAEHAYNAGQYKEAEDMLLKFIDSGTPHAYWLARGFILLSDVYVKTDRDMEAKQYLLSLKSNYTESKEINNMIADRLTKLK